MNQPPFDPQGGWFMSERLRWVDAHHGRRSSSMRSPSGDRGRRGRVVRRRTGPLVFLESQHGLQAVGHVELAIDAIRVGLYRLLRDEQLRGDHFVRHARGDHAQDLQLSSRKTADAAGRLGVVGGVVAGLRALDLETTAAGRSQRHIRRIGLSASEQGEIRLQTTAKAREDDFDDPIARPDPSRESQDRAWPPPPPAPRSAGNAGRRRSAAPLAAPVAADCSAPDLAYNHPR